MVSSNDAFFINCAHELAAAMLLTFYIVDNALYGMNIALQLIDAGAQIQAWLQKRVKTLWKKIDVRASIQTTTVYVCACYVCTVWSSVRMHWYTKLDTVNPEILTVI